MFPPMNFFGTPPHPTPPPPPHILEGGDTMNGSPKIRLKPKRFS